nr:MAG TPA: hypothetical protein [Caudoviricetes sp.]
MSLDEPRIKREALLIKFNNLALSPRAVKPPKGYI